MTAKQAKWPPSDLSFRPNDSEEDVPESGYDLSPVLGTMFGPYAIVWGAIAVVSLIVGVTSFQSGVGQQQAGQPTVSSSADLAYCGSQWY